MTIDAAPRAFTPEEMEEKFYLKLQQIAEYWANIEKESEYQRCLGMVHSILSLSAGAHIDMPAIDIVFAPHPDDKQYHINNGENWVEPKTLIQPDGHSFYRCLENHNLPKK